MQFPANALLHRPKLLEYVMAEKIKVGSTTHGGKSAMHGGMAHCNTAWQYRCRDGPAIPYACMANVRRMAGGCAVPCDPTFA